MASAIASEDLTVDEYLHTTYRPDVDYIDGHIEERNPGEFDHGSLTLRIARLLDDRRLDWHIRVALETRVQVGAHRFRVPDVCVTRADLPREQILRTPPILCIEVLSPEDTLRKMLKRSEDYFAMGVSEVWIFDPQARSVHVQAGAIGTSHLSGHITMAGTQITLIVEDVFSVLDHP